jgi:hypothetical protein
MTYLYLKLQDGGGIYVTMPNKLTVEHATATFAWQQLAPSIRIVNINYIISERLSVGRTVSDGVPVGRSRL